jgi:UDP-N-acetylmuramoyl-tripeptide--D-alanyl-D-alanine ligase
MQIEALYNIFKQYPNVQTDTRKLKKDDLYFALKGDNFNGNNFAAQALEMDAAYCICDEKQPIDTDKIIYVDDVLTTLQQLAKYHRQQFTIPFLAITGSNGKTTTKELIYAVLKTQLKCYTTVGNLNNHIGVPLTLLSIKNDAEIAVIEMGANHQKEIASYCEYALPNYGLINNCGKAHLEGFGGIEGVRKGKGELYDFIAANNGKIFINTDYDYLVEMGKKVAQQISYGTANASTTGIIANNNELLKVQITAGANINFIQTHLAGEYNLPNVLSAVCVGKYFGISDENILQAIEGYVPSNSRSQIIQQGSNTILLDAYNANPTSMKAAIENFAKMPGDKKIVVLGGMMELGEESKAEHASIVALLQQFSWAHVLLAGKDYGVLPKGYLHFSDALEIKQWLNEQKIENGSFLIKGSRGMAMERVLN